MASIVRLSRSNNVMIERLVVQYKVEDSSKIKKSQIKWRRDRNEQGYI
jgi:hypothetical protein